LDTLAFSCVLFGKEDPYTSGGALFPVPPGSDSEKQIAYYSKAVSGWHVCPLGYAVYAVLVAPERKLVVYGLKVKGVSTIKGRREGLSINLDRFSVEAYMANIMRSIEQLESDFQAIIATGVHEFRNINKDLYHAAYSLRVFLEDDFSSHLDPISRAKNIESLSELLRVRSDIFDLMTLPQPGSFSKKNFAIYKSFDRVRMSLFPSASIKGVYLGMSGRSHGRGRAVEMFDVVPYIVIQNAIKYAPNGSKVDINIAETEEEIVSTVSSTGPILAENEQKKIFERNFRGQYAQSVSGQGSGLGLFIAKVLVDACDGASITFRQDGPVIEWNRVPYQRTHVRVVLRRSKE